jgi:uncharacterized protein (TIGR00290 family)
MPLIVAWSGGKDSALALADVLSRSRDQVVSLLTTVTAGHDRISMHGVRRTLLHRQAAALGLPLHEVMISPQSSNEEYEAQMGAALAELTARTPALDGVVFGDLFLQDIRAYRERMLARIGLRALFPLWLRDTGRLAAEFVRRGYKAILACVDSHALAPAFAGREFDTALLAALPPGVDPCGENGEFHTFVYAGPIFTRAIALSRGAVVVRDGRFVYCDLMERTA